MLFLLLNNRNNTYTAQWLRQVPLCRLDELPCYAIMLVSSSIDPPTPRKKQKKIAKHIFKKQTKQKS